MHLAKLFIELGGVVVVVVVYLHWIDADDLITFLEFLLFLDVYKLFLKIA